MASAPLSKTRAGRVERRLRLAPASLLSAGQTSSFYHANLPARTERENGEAGIGWLRRVGGWGKAVMSGA